MKSYTDIEQSRKLAEILPLESADMLYYCNKSNNIPISQYPFIRSFKENGTFSYLYCWSLAALLEEMPEIINFDGDKSVYALEILKECGLYYLSYGNLLGRIRIEIEPQECFIDACYEMILKLHEQKLL